MNGNEIDLIRSKTPSSFVFRGKKYRISILSDTLIRFEYSENGTFNDYPTFFASNRSFGKPKIGVQEDENILVIKNDRFTLEYMKEKPFIGSKLSPEQNLRVTINDTNKMWYFNHPEVKNFGGSTFSLDDMKSSVTLDKGLFSIDGFASFDDSRTPVISQTGNIIAPNYKNIDTYLFVYSSEFGLGLRDYFNLTSLPPLIPRYALGVWWAKNESYNESDLLKLINNFSKYEIPFSALVLGEYSRANYNTNVSFSFNKNIFPNPKALSAYLHKNNIYLGTNIKTDGTISEQEENYSAFAAENKTGSNEVNVFNSEFMANFLNNIINPYINNGIDFLWVDDSIREHSL